MTGQTTQYDDTVTVSSSLPEYSHVRYTINILTHGKRTQLRLRLAPMLEEMRDILGELDKHLESMQNREDAQNSEIAAVISIDQTKEVKEDQSSIVRRCQFLQERVDLLTASRIDPEYLRAGLVAIEGITMKDGAAYSADSMYQRGPESLCKEIITECRRQAGLEDRERANLESPTTSGAPVVGQTSDLIAPIAEKEVYTNVATV